MKPFFKAVLFLLLLTALDFLLRKGLLAFYLPFQLPQNANILLLFTLFALSAWQFTRWFGKSDKMTLLDLGITLSAQNRLEFYYGFVIGVVLWAVVSLLQSFSAGFSWELRPEVSLYHLVYGLLFIFIADLGTELYTRGYPLRSFEKSVGPYAAILLMMVFVGFKSYSSQVTGEHLFYTILIPVLHTLFFSIIYFKTRRLGAALGIHTGANFVTISIFDLSLQMTAKPYHRGGFFSQMSIWRPYPLPPYNSHGFLWPLFLAELFFGGGEVINDSKPNNWVEKKVARLIFRQMNA